VGGRRRAWEARMWGWEDVSVVGGDHGDLDLKFWISEEGGQERNQEEV